MNILIYTEKSSYDDHRVGGAETSLRLLAEKLAEKGHRVFYLTQIPRRRRPQYRKETIDGVEVHRLGLPDLPSKGLQPLLRFRAWTDGFLFDQAVRRIVQKHAIDLVHTCHEVPGMYRLLKLRERYGFDYAAVLRMGGLFWVEKLSRYPNLHEQYDYVFNRVDCINPNTPGLYRLFEKEATRYGLDLSTAEPFVHDIGVRNTQLPFKWNPPEGEFTQARPFRMVMASRLSKHQKRQDLLLEAMALLPASTPVRLSLIGDGPNRETLQGRIRELDLKERVELVPFLPQEKLWKVMAGCHLYVHACDFEGLSKMILEAMGMGMPVLASNVVPVNDYLEDGHTGFLARNTPKSWAETVQTLMNNPERLSQVAESGRIEVGNRFDPDRNIGRYEQRFMELTAAKR